MGGRSAALMGVARAGATAWLTAARKADLTAAYLAALRVAYLVAWMAVS
jgi:hypothetical protein